MKILRIQIGVQRPEDSLKEAKAIARRIDAGAKLPEREEELYFSNLDVFRKALSPKRLDLLWAIAEHTPRSVRELAGYAERDIKNVSQDLAFLSRLGLVELKGNRRGAAQAPTLLYDEINLNIHIHF